jgi:hypothetical protein
VPRYFARSLARHFRSMYEERDTHVEYRRLGVIVAGAMSVFDLKKEADSAFETFDTLFLPRIDDDVRIELVRECLAEKGLAGVPDALVEVLARETSGERAFLDPILYALAERRQPLSEQVVRDVIYVATGEKASLPELCHVALRMALDAAHLEILEQLAQGMAVRPRDATADIDRFQLLGAVVLDRSIHPPVYQFRNLMVRRYVTRVLPIIRKYCVMPHGVDGPTPTADEREAMVQQWPGLQNVIRLAACGHQAAMATDIWSCARALADGWHLATPYEGQPDLRFCVTQRDSQSVWWLTAHDARTVKVARYRQREVWERALNGALATRRTFFATSDDDLSVGLPFHHDRTSVVVVATIGRARVNGQLSEAALGHWLDFLQHAGDTITRLAFAAIAQHALELSWFCSGESASTPFWANAGESPRARVFIVMPFAAAFTKVQKAIEKAAAAHKATVLRGDDFFGAQVVMSDVWRGILNADVVVADLTGRNPNVLYEVGLCHVIGKQVVLLAQAETDIPFDVAAWRHIRYADDKRGLEELEQKLAKSFEQLGLGPAHAARRA